MISSKQLLISTDEDIESMVREMYDWLSDDTFIIEREGCYTETNKEGFIKEEIELYKDLRQGLINSN